MRRRETGLFLFAAAIVAASLFTETRRDVVAASADKDDAARSARPGSQVAALDVDEWLARLKARSMNAAPGGAGLFGGTTWQPQPPAAALPSKPVTPEFPFRLLGRMTLDGATVIILAKGEQAYPVKVGDVIEQFRIDRIDDDALRVTYVPNGEARDYRKEDLYPQVAAAAVPSLPLPQFAPPPQAAPPPAQGQPAASASAKTPAADPPVRAAGGISADAAAGAQGMPLSQMPGVSAPIGGMVIMPAPPGSGMLVVPTAPANLMNIAPTPPGGGMVMTPVPPGVVMPGVPTPSGSPSAPGSN